MNMRRAAIDRVEVRKIVEAADRQTSADIVVSIAPFFIGDVWSAAWRAFEHLGIAQKPERNGVLVFVVPARRQVVVIADDGAHDRLDRQLWSDAVSDIADGFARGDGTAGLSQGISRLAQALRDHFPP